MVLFITHFTPLSLGEGYGGEAVLGVRPGTGVRLVMVRLVEAFSLLSSLTKLKTT